MFGTRGNSTIDVIVT